MLIKNEWYRWLFAILAYSKEEISGKMNSYQGLHKKNESTLTTTCWQLLKLHFCATKMLDYLILNCHWGGWMTINWLWPKGFRFIGKIQTSVFLWNLKNFKNNFYYRTFAVMLLIIFMFLQIEIVFIKWEQNQRWPPDAYINNDYMLQFKYDIEKTKN